MNERSLKVLEYNKIIDKLQSFAVSDMAKDCLRMISPLNSKFEIEEKLKEVTEAVNISVKKGNIPMGELYNINGPLNLSRKGGTLTTRMILEILYNMKVAENIESYLKEDSDVFPWLTSVGEVIITFPRLVNKIERIIISEDEIADSASPVLKDIRREIRKANDQIKVKLNSMITTSDSKSYLQDAIVTMREGRYVVPVKAEYRQKVNGIVHDQSQTGQTLFIEPQAIVELNNRLRELELKEKVEIERILLELSSNISEHYHELINNQKLLIELDTVFAKAKLSIEMDASSPSINEDGVLNLIKARHPLIDKKKVKPIDIHIGDGFTSLIITGPNTGGKTVTLKTVGLLQLMAQSGLHIPCYERSTLPIFDDIFSDIGDEQSIEQNLSTFSSHMKNTVEFVTNATFGTLVLLDELGAGTDPTEGAALGISILESLKSSGATVIATTHYNELKKYALSTEGVMNASMQFDVETLSPTYKLLIGIPGKSNAFEISKKLGLKREIIDRASELIETGDLEFEDVISKIEEDTKRAEESRIKADALLIDLKEKESMISSREKLLLEHEKATIDKAKEEARNMISEAKEEVALIQKELRSLNKINNFGERNKRLADIKSSLSEAEKKYRTGIVKKENENPVSIEDVKIGDRVKFLTIDQNGEVLTLPDDVGNLQIKVGSMKVKVNVSELMYIGDTVGEKKKTKGSIGSLRTNKAMNISSSKNVIGKNLDDAIVEVEKYLDDAYIGGLQEVTIIHGRGEGILKNGIRDILKHHQFVDSYHKGTYEDGGEGVTVVKFKKG